MSYTKTGALGYALTFNVPGVGTQKIFIPLENAISDAENLALVQLKTKGIPAAEAALPGLAKKAMPILKKDVLPPLLKQATDQVTTKLWPALKPEVQSVATSTALLFGLAIALPIGVSTWWLTKQVRRSKP